MKTQNKARAQAPAKPRSLTSSGPEKDVSSLNEICSECGRSVAMGSGRFVNRVTDLDDFETRKENGKRYPKGDFICAECDEKARATVSSARFYVRKWPCAVCGKPLLYDSKVEVRQCGCSLEYGKIPDSVLRESFEEAK